MISKSCSDLEVEEAELAPIGGDTWPVARSHPCPRCLHVSQPRRNVAVDQPSTRQNGRPGFGEFFCFRFVSPEPVLTKRSVSIKQKRHFKRKNGRFFFSLNTRTCRRRRGRRPVARAETASGADRRHASGSSRAQPRSRSPRSHRHRHHREQRRRRRQLARLHFCLLLCRHLLLCLLLCRRRRRAPTSRSVCASACGTQCWRWCASF